MAFVPFRDLLALAVVFGEASQVGFLYCEFLKLGQTLLRFLESVCVVGARLKFRDWRVRRIVTHQNQRTESTSATPHEFFKPHSVFDFVCISSWHIISSPSSPQTPRYSPRLAMLWRAC